MEIHVKKDATSKAEETKRTAKAQRAVRVEWFCHCTLPGSPLARRRNRAYLNNCLDCGCRREHGTPDGTPV